MRFDKIKEDMALCETKDSLTLDDALALLKDVGTDVIRSCGPIEDCPVGDAEDVNSLLLWLSSLILAVDRKQGAALSDQLRYGRFQSQMREMKKEMSELEAQRQDLGRKIDRKKVELSRTRQELRKLNQEWGSAAHEYEELKQNLDNLKGRREELDEALRKIGRMQSIIKQLEADSALFADRPDRQPFALDAALKEEMRRCEAALRAESQAVSSYVELQKNEQGSGSRT